VADARVPAEDAVRIGRRSFLGTISAAFAVGFAKVETAVVDNYAVDWGLATGDWTGYTFHSVPILTDAYLPKNMILMVSGPMGQPSNWLRERFINTPRKWEHFVTDEDDAYINRLMPPPDERARLLAGEWLNEGGDSGDPTSRE
jgi:hypothetical protein